MRKLLTLILAVFVLGGGWVTTGSRQADAHAAQHVPTAIMGGQRLSPSDIASWFKATTKQPYRASVSVEELAKLYLEEGAIEGVRGDIAFAQGIKETAWFNFPDCNGCQVRPEHNNFAGIGACNSCATGYQFANARLGVRAHIQLLRIYAENPATNSMFANPVVPPINADTHPYRNQSLTTWQSLDGKWAVPGVGYGDSVLDIFSGMLSWAGVSDLCPPDAPPRSAQSSGSGYWSVASDGGVFTFGAAQFFGSTGNLRLNSPVVSIIGTNNNGGYWLFAQDGGVFSFGNAAFYGSTGNIRLNSPVIGMAATPSGGGYWLVAKDGGVFSFGDARFYGSTGGMRLNRPVSGMATTPSGNGYWLVAEDGGVFAFGDASFQGSVANLALKAPVIGITPSGSGGYWMLGRDGGIFSFGGAPFFGSLGGCVNRFATTLQPSPSGGGYYIATSEGRIATFGDAKHFGYIFAANAPPIGLAVLK